MELLEKYFDTAFAAPDGVKKLRELILTLAMQGKLVKQDACDQPASELLKSIEAEKTRLEKAGKIKKPKTLPEIKAEEMPYVLPSGWEWVRLGTITLYNGRKNIKGKDIAPDCWLLDLEDIEKDTSRLIYKSQFSERESKSTKSTFLKGDVLYGKLRPYLDKVIVADDDGVCTTEIVPIVPLGNIIPWFIRWLLKRPAFLSHVNSLMYGVKMPRLGTDDALLSVHPLPPLEEQRRIVAQIDQLMARCDELEKLRMDKEQMRLDVHTAALRKLLDSQEQNSFADAWGFLTKHFGDLYSVKENVAELRKAILQLAVMGKLVEQDPNDQPASELLKEIEAERKKLIEAKEIKKPKALPEINEEEKPYALPSGWEWVRLGEIGETNIGLTYSPSDVADSGTPVLRSSNIQNGKLDLSDIKRVSCDVKKTAYVQNGNLLICARNGSRALVGKTAIIENLKEKMAFGAFMAVFRSRANNYLLHFINSPLFRRVIDEVGTMTINQITQKNLRSTVCPLPPFEEQHRIVTKVDQLMALCDDLEHLIDTVSGTQNALLNAVMAQV